MQRPHTPMRSLAALSIVAILGGCSTLPRDGPSGRNVERGALASNLPASYDIVDLDYAASERIRSVPAPFFGSLAADGAQGQGGLIGSGDILAVSIFEPSGSLFSGSTGSANRPVSSTQTLPPLTVDASGTISIPFAGSVQVSGLTGSQAAASVRRALIGKIANPQVVVSISENAYNTVTVLGEVKQPGRAPLSSNADRLVDVIANRGGVARPIDDVQVSIQRGAQTFAAPLSVVLSEFNENIRLERGDQIQLLYKPRRFSTFGALGAVSQQEMAAGPLTLVGALSRVGGLDNNSANARAVLVFRFERPEIAQALGITRTAQSRGVPIVYRLDLEQAEGFFIANNFAIQPDDIVYVPRSGSAELGKFFTLIRTISGVVYDISVTNTLNNN